MMGEHPVVIEMEVSLEVPPLQHSGEPVDVIGPHVVVGNLLRGHPVGSGFVGFDRIPKASLRSKDDAVEGETVHELKMELPRWIGFSGVTRSSSSVSRIAACKAVSPVSRRPPGPLILPAPRPLFADHQDLSLPAHKTEGGLHGRLPVLPESGIV